MRIMLTGASGQVGWELARSLMPLGEVIALDRTQCDLSRPETISGIVQQIKPDVIVNAAAYTAVDKAEEEEALARRINGEAPAILAEEMKQSGGLLVHYSTDYVFDGKKTDPYTEDDLPNPMSVYGHSKLSGEKAIQESGVNHLIFRTSWVCSSRGHNFVNTILRLAREKKELNIIDDQYGAPTWARNIADVTVMTLASLHHHRSGLDVNALGIYNLSASGRTTWYGLAVMILEEAAKRELLPSSALPELNPIPTEAYPLPALRPKNSILDGEKLRLRFNIAMPNYRAALERCLDELV